MKYNPGAYEVVRPITEKIQELSEKYNGVLQGGDITKSEIESDIRSLEEVYQNFQKVAGTKKKQDRGVIEDYRKICDELITCMDSTDKTQNFNTHKDSFLENIYSNKRSIGDVIMSKIKDFLEALGFEQNRSEMHKTEKFVDKILQERQAQTESRGCGG